MSTLHPPHSPSVRGLKVHETTQILSRGIGASPQEPDDLNPIGPSATVDSKGSVWPRGVGFLALTKQG